MDHLNTSVLDCGRGRLLVTFAVGEIISVTFFIEAILFEGVTDNLVTRAGVQTDFFPSLK